MKKVFVFTMFFVTVIAVFLFVETMRLQFWNEKKMHGTFISVQSIGGIL